MTKSPQLGFLLTLVLLPLTIHACRTSSRRGADVKRVSYSQAKAAESARQACEHIADKTSQNICFLTEYAKLLLSQTSDFDDISNMVAEKFKQNGIQAYLPISIYRIAPKPGGTCFSHDSHPVESENFYNNQVEQIRKQIENVAEFLAQYHVDIDGQDPGPFGIKDIELCPISMTQGRKLALHGSTLTIGLPVKGLVSTSYGWYSFTELRGMWDRGEMFEKTYSIKQRVIDLFAGEQTSFIWKIANPAGPIRNPLRQLLRNQGQDILKRLTSLRRSETNMSPEERARTVRSVLDLDKTSPSSQNFYIPEVLNAVSSDLEKVLNGGEQKVDELLSEWQCQTEKMLASSEIANAAIGGLVERSESTNVTYDIKASWVAVANFHNINIDVFGLYASHNQFIETPRVNEQNFNFKVKAEGRVVVVTGDQVNVTTAINVLTSSVKRTIYTEGLHKSMTNISKVPDKAQWCTGKQRS